MQGKRTREEDIQMVREIKLKDPQMSSRDISELTWINHVTVCEIVNKEYKNNPDFKAFIDNAQNVSRIEKIRWADELNIDTDLLKEFLEYIGWVKEAKENIEWFMLQSIGRWYIRRKTIKQNTRYSILAQNNFKCSACWANPSKDNDVTLHIDHILPFSMWWLDVESNYQVLCLQCNTSKGNSFFIKH